MPSVLNGLSQLTERGVLVSANSKQRNRIWLAHPVIDALDAFAERTRR
ncbi:hypothetical protein [Pseudoclavibacter helvolus]